MPKSLDRMGVYYISSNDSTDDVIKNWREITQNLNRFFAYGYNNKEQFQICLSSYYNVWEDEKTPMYFSLPMIEWGKDALLDFNKQFKNIQIEILDEQYVYYNDHIEDGDYGKHKLDELTFEEGDHKIYLPLFTVKFSDDYSKLSKYLIPMMVGMYVRLFAINDYYSHWTDKKPKDLNFLQYACDHNDKYSGEYEIHVFHAKNSIIDDLLPEHILYLDDLELMNRAFKAKTSGYYCGNRDISIGTHVYQTSVINKLYDVKNNGKENVKEKKKPVDDLMKDFGDEEEEIVEEVKPVKKVKKVAEEVINFDEEEFLREVKKLMGE